MAMRRAAFQPNSRTPGLGHPVPARRPGPSFLTQKEMEKRLEFPIREQTTKPKKRSPSSHQHQSQYSPKHYETTFPHLSCETSVLLGRQLRQVEQPTIERLRPGIPQETHPSK